MEEQTQLDEYEIFLNKRTDKIYMSKSIDITQMKFSENKEMQEIIRQNWPVEGLRQRRWGQ